MEKNNEKSQEQILFENVCLQLVTGDYRGYSFKSTGNIVHWLRALGLIYYDVTIIGWKNELGEVHLHGKLIATYHFDFVLKIPIFQFKAPYLFMQDRQEKYISGLTKFEDPYKNYGKILTDIVRDDKEVS
ncbi:MAG: hypothetical protein HC836_39285 [Richelia sp. RM2_1_2]|nr:hypothetical protein [Richelia sp. RM2_1_2]